MDHIRQHDWNVLTPDTHYFVTDKEMDDSCIEKILQNRFFDPLARKPIEDEARKNINWAEVFKQKDIRDNGNKRMLHVPGIKGQPPYPKMSALTSEQHRQCLKVLCSQHPDILPTKYMKNPSSMDYTVYQIIQQDYEKEQKEFQDWAKSLWHSGHNIRALKPPDLVENTYEAEFNMRTKELQCLPKNYEFTAQIPFENTNMPEVKLAYQEQLINYDVRTLPHYKFPDVISKHLSILKPLQTPKPCEKHPCKFVLPNEKTITELPLTEVHRQLAQYSLDNGCQFIASETALRCLLETDRQWNVPVTVCSVVDADGDKHNIVVLGSEFSLNREFCTTRTYRAYRHLLYNTLVPLDERKRCMNRDKNVKDIDPFDESWLISDDSDDDDDDKGLVIDIDTPIKQEPIDNEQSVITDDDEPNQNDDVKPKDENRPILRARRRSDRLSKSSKSSKTNVTEKMPSFSECTCKDLFEKPFPRSYSKWTIKSEDDKDLLNFIVHYSHKCRGSTGEVILEPIPEYQLDLGASAQSDEKMMSLAMMLYLRRKSSLLNVRIDGQTGEVVCGDSIFLEEMLSSREDVIDVATSRIYCALEEMSRLVPGNYILTHEPQHGLNALLYMARKVKNPKCDTFVLDFDVTAADEEKESKFLKNAPTLAPVLLPSHKFRNTLPLAFTTLPQLVAKQPIKKTINRTKTPPKAIKWPKRKSNRRQRRNN